MTCLLHSRPPSQIGTAAACELWRSRDLTVVHVQTNTCVSYNLLTFLLIPTMLKDQSI